jgi:ABC-type multidrug transport system permease subunit
MKSLRQIFFFALKDLAIFTRQPTVMFTFILFPLLLVVLFNYVLGGVVAQDTRLEIHLVTQEPGSQLSRRIIDDLVTEDESKLKPGEPKFVKETDYASALRAVEEGRLKGFIAFPEDFTKGVLMGYGTTLTVVVNPEATNLRPALNGVAEAIAASFGLQQAARSAMNGLLVEDSLAGTAGAAAGAATAAENAARQAAAQQGISLRDSLIKFGVEKVGETETPNPANYVIPGYLVMFVFIAAAASSSAIVLERQNNTLERLLASSVRGEAILGGIFAGTAVKGIIQIIIFWGAGILFFKIDLGLAPAAVFILSILTVLMSSAYAVLLATLVKTRRAAGSIAVLSSLALAPLGGCWWPLFVTPRWMQYLALFTPHGWANIGFNKLMVFGADFSAAIPEMLALAGFTLVFFVIAAVRFRTGAD